jgi:hypothetical protein
MVSSFGPNRAEPLRARRLRAEPLEEAGRVGLNVGQLGAAGHQQQIGLVFVLQVVDADVERQAVGAAHAARTQADERDLVVLVRRKVVVGLGKHVHRACDVQCLHPVEHDDHELHV